MSNNQYGICCECPAFMSDGRFITNWEPTRQYNFKLNNLLKINDNNNNTYRKQLIEHPVEVISSFESTKCNKNIQLNTNPEATIELRSKNFIKSVPFV